MATIYELTETSAVSNGDFLPLFSLQSGDARKVQMHTILAFIREASVNRLATQYAAPSATAFVVQVNTNTHLILTPAAVYDNGQIVLPSAPLDRDEILVNTTEAVTALAFDGSGKLISGEPTSLAANSFFRLKYDGVLNTWFRIA